jgi:psp operon transcriptional activator
VRIVAATNENLPQMAEEGLFRADLLDRLSFEVITLPPLRVREGDIDVLADFFGRRMAAEIGWERWPGFAQHVRQQLEEYPWPATSANCATSSSARSTAGTTGPIRSATSSSIRSTARGSPSRCRARTAKAPVGASHPAASAHHDYDTVEDLRIAVEAHERAILEHHLGRNRWNQRQTAKALG